MNIETLGRGRIIAGRSINVEMNKDGTIDAESLSRDRPLKLTYIADSNDVEILIFERKSMIFLPENIQKLLKEGVSELRDVDDTDVEEILKKESQWRSYKKKALEFIMGNK